MNFKLKNDTFLRALLRQPTEYTPLWMMRQAGRFLPEYRATRKEAGSFMGLCKNPDYATKVTLQPVDRYPLDAAILFSDILTVPDAMGLGLYFSDGEGPKFERPLHDEASIMALRVPDVDKDLRYVTDAVSQIRKSLDGRIPLIGFSGSPFTLSCYMVEGGSTSDYAKVKTLMYNEPKLMHHILEVTTQAVIAYLNAQIEAGAQAVMIFDSWGGVLSHAAFHEFSLAYTQRIIDGLIKEKDGVRIPNIVFTKGGGLWIDGLANTGCDALGLDWTMDIGIARQKVGQKVALQGNMDPAVLFANPDAIRGEVEKVLSSYGYGSGHVFNLGHGISQHTSTENVAVMVAAVHELSRKYH